jgi:hypothetical protein
MLVDGLETHEGPPSAGIRQGQPRPSAGAARGGTGPLPGGREVRAPVAGWSGQTRDGPAITRGGPGPPGESGSAGATQEPACPPR